MCFFFFLGIDVAGMRTHFYPEGGWGWLVCAAGFLAMLLTTGMQLAFGVLHLYAARHLGERHLMDIGESWYKYTCVYTCVCACLCEWVCVWTACNCMKVHKMACARSFFAGNTIPEPETFAIYIFLAFFHPMFFPTSAKHDIMQWPRRWVTHQREESQKDKSAEGERERESHNEKNEKEMEKEEKKLLQFFSFYLLRSFVRCVLFPPLLQYICDRKKELYGDNTLRRFSDENSRYLSAGDSDLAFRAHSHFPLSLFLHIYIPSVRISMPMTCSIIFFLQYSNKKKPQAYCFVCETLRFVQWKNEHFDDRILFRE